MGIDSAVIAQDPVDVEALFDAARQVVGDPPEWHEFGAGDIRVFQSSGGQGAVAQASVHFPKGGSRFPREQRGQPDGYAVVSFTSGSEASPDAERTTHGRLIEAVGMWLSQRGLRWSWQYEGCPWEPGQPGPVKPCPC